MKLGATMVPVQYSTIRESAVGLSNDLIQKPTWDPEYLHSHNMLSLSVEKILDYNIPIG